MRKRLRDLTKTFRAYLGPCEAMAGQTLASNVVIKLHNEAAYNKRSVAEDTLYDVCFFFIFHLNMLLIYKAL